MARTTTQILENHDRLVATEPRYVVVCLECGQDWLPLITSPLWWQAKKRADKGFLDALHVSGEKCGCAKKVYRPEAPFRVFGYDSMCEDYDIPFDTFTAAAKAYIKASRSGDIVFISGVSPAVEEKLRLMF